MKFHFPEPEKETFTVYCRSECIHWVKIKELLKKQQIEQNILSVIYMLRTTFVKLNF